MESKVNTKEYLAGGGVECLVCGSSDIEGGAIDFDAGELYQNVTCHACGATWDDVYTLTGVTQVTIK